MAFALHRTGKCDEALSTLASFPDKTHRDRIGRDNAAIKLEPDAVRLNNRGNAYAARAQYDRAIQDFDAAVTLDAKYPIALYNRGNAHFAKGDPDRAIQSYDQALLKLYQDEINTMEEALANADSRTNLEAKINFG